MSVSNGKLDLDVMLRSWPAPAADEAAWEQRAENIVRAATAATGSSSEFLALFEAPVLEAEPGEPDASVISAGEKRMSQESDQSSPSQRSEEQKTEAPSSAPSVPAPKPSERKRGSLKEMAARVSQAGVTSRPGLAGPPASSRSSAAPGVSASSASARPAEAGPEDSGIINLNTVKSSATPEQKKAAEAAQPAAHDLAEEGDEKLGKEAKPAAAKTAKSGKGKAASGQKSAKAAVAAVPAAKAEEKKSSGGMMVGIAIAVVGLAAAFAITQMRKPEQPTANNVATQAAPSVTAQAAPDKPAEPNTAKTAEPLAANALDNAPSEETASGSAEKSPSGAGAQAAGAGAAAPSAQPSAEEKTAEATDKPSAPAPTDKPAAPAKPGDLASAMAAAVGDQGKKDGPTAENAEPASASRSQSIPEQPSQGSVAAAIGAVMPSAKACVAGADDVSRAQVTFASSGAVKSVSVTGWAAAHGASGCVKSALMGAKVSPFSKPSFTLGVTIRP